MQGERALLAALAFVLPLRAVAAPTSTAPTERDDASDAAPSDPPADSAGGAPEDAATATDPSEPQDDGWSFEVEDISEDAEALEADLKEGEVQAEGTVGSVHGVVRDTHGDAIAGAHIEVLGRPFVARTGLDGSYHLDLPPGTYTIVAREELHEAIELPGVSVSAAATIERDFELRAQGSALVVEVEADANVEGDAGVLLERQQDDSSTDSMSRAEMARSGGGKVTSVASRMVGNTVVGGRFVFVRGLGHRYGNTLLDGARVPSPEPELRTVPLDIFPSGALGAITVQKSFTPDVPGDFAGGSIQLVTREIPMGTTLGLAIELEANTATTFQPMLHSGGFAAHDFFGFGNLDRALPSAIPKEVKAGRGVIDPETFETIHDEAEVERQGEALLTDTRVRRGRNAPLNGKLSLTVGKGWSTPHAGKFGLLAAGGYANAHQSVRERIRMYGGDGTTGELDTGTPQVDFRTIKTEQNVRWSALGLARLDVTDDHRLELSSLYSRDASDETRELRGIAPNVSGLDPILSSRLRYVMRALWFNRLGARHRFPVFAGKHRIQLDYFGAYSQARRDDPAIREMLYLADDDCDLVDVAAPCAANVDQSAGAVGDQTYLALVDDNVNGAINLEIPFDQWSQLRTTLKFGGWAEGKRREFGVRRFTYQIATGLNDAVPGGTGTILDADSIGGGQSASDGGTEPFALRELTRPLDNYRADQQLFAGYGMLTLPLARWVRISGGARIETSTITVEPFDLFALTDAESPDCATDLDAPECLRTRLQTTDLLPAAAVIFSPRLAERFGTMNVRAMASQTVARPEFRELAPFAFTDFVGGFNVLGNPHLRSTKIWNGELRWEWFPSGDDVIAVTGFYKNFRDPIEQVVNPNTPATASFVNAKAATNLGGELELRKGLDFLARRGTRARDLLRMFAVGSNFAYVHSRVELLPPCYAPGESPPAGVPNPEDYVEREGCNPAIDAVTSRERPLQGQSPYVLNAFVDFDNQRSGTYLRLLFNIFGRRIYAVSTQGLPDIYEEPVPGLDLVFSQRILAVKKGRDADLRNELRFDAGATNLLNPAIRHTQGSSEVSTYEAREGVSVSAGFTWSY